MLVSKPANEEDRLRQLADYEILDTLPEQAYDDITFLASQICGTPIALMSLVDAERQWFKSDVGLGVPETHRDLAFCAHAILEPTELMEVPDALKDKRFADNDLVTGDPKIRFYAGAPLVTGSGAALGTLCVIDRVPRQLTDEQRALLRALSRQVMAQLELRKALREVRVAEAERSEYARMLEDYQRKLEASLDELSRESGTDPLTGIANRRMMERILSDEWARASRYATPLSVALVDLDHFKEYNDREGHQAGDDALRATARALESVCRRSDAVARYGGEEFLMILPHTDTDGAFVMGERIRRSFEVLGGPTQPITASVGVASADEGMSGPDELVAAADRALYEAKEAGRNRVVRSTPKPRADAPA